MNVLSLFDGMSCCQIALNRIGIKPAKYYAAELDKYAITVTQANYPDTIQLGDVTKWREWNIDWASIDLVGAGFPCQSWSVAGQQLGDKDERGMLFWTTLEIIAEVLKYNPKAKFLMENVKMKKEFEEYITHHTTEALGCVEKTLINSALVSAQNRNRYYWTNFKVEQPQDKGVLLRDILEETNNELRPCERIKEGNEGHIANTTDIKGMDCIKRVYGQDGKAPTLTTMGGGHREPKVLINESRRQLVFNPAAIVGRKLDENGKRNDSLNQKPVQCLEVQAHGKSRCLSTVAKDTVISPMKPGRYPLINLEDSHYNERCKRQIRKNSKTPDRKAVSLCANSNLTGSGVNVITTDHIHYRKLTPIECERLQTVLQYIKPVEIVLCYDQAKSFVSAVEKNPKLLKLVSSAGSEELKEYAKLASQSTNANQASTKYIAPQSVGMQTQTQTKKCTKVYQDAQSLAVSNAESTTTCKQVESAESSVIQSAFINITEGKITHFGKEASHQIGQSYMEQMNGKIVLNLSGKDMMQNASDALSALETMQTNSHSTSITSFRLSTKNLEQMLIISYWFAKNAIDGFTQDTTQEKTLYLTLIDGYTAHVSNTQRYRMLGNGFTVEVISHILSCNGWTV